MKVLIIEDDAKKLNKILKVLNDNFSDIEILHTHYMKEAFSLIKNNSDLDFIFLDFNFPRYNDDNKTVYNAGLEVISKFNYYYKDNYDKTNIIVTSSENQTDTVNNFLKSTFIKDIKIDTSIVYNLNSNFSASLYELIKKKLKG